MQLNKKQFLNAVLALFVVGTEEKLEATFSEVKLESSDTNVLTVDTDVNGDGTIDIVGKGAGSAKVRVTANASWVDPTSEEPQSEEKTAEVEFTVNLPEPGNTEMRVSFTDPAFIPVPPVETGAVD